jgi:4-amino-4-deoxy-L-arabinose transferase-like glycosyltransferase
MQRNVERYQQIFVAARSMIIAMAVLLGIVVFWWAGSMYGWLAGLAALGLFCFSPSMLAHGHLVTLDMSGALGFTLTAYATWRLLAEPGWMRAAAVGAALGIATLLKLSGFVLVAVVVVCLAIRAIAERRRSDAPSPSRWFGMLAVTGSVTLAVLNLGYGFEGTFAPLSAATLDERGAIAQLASLAPWLRLPVPLPFLNGVDMVLNVGKQSDPSYFFAGHLSSEGWWYYHIASFFLKTPIPFAVAAVAALLLWIGGARSAPREYCLYVPVLLIFVSNSLFNSLQIGVRHVLPVYPLLMIGASPWLVWLLQGWRSPGTGTRRFAAVAGGLAVFWYAAGTVAVAPRYLQYFNEAAGGASGGHRYLVDSNIDWGQDLIRLREYMDDQGLERINLAYFGRVHPAVYGIRFQPLERGRSQGPTAVSATFLMGRPYFWFLGGRLGWVPSGTYTWLQQYEPVARVGSMFVYDLEADPGVRAN